jgi:geranylgeranyl pyrophosphate synthase
MNRTSVPPPVTRVLEASEAWLPRRMAAVERRLTDLVGAAPDPLGGEARATLAAGGKRLRPKLVLHCAGPEAGDGATRAATAIELVHMATLVHDDVLDAAPLRRGHPTVVARAGREVATSVGDLLFSRAFAELADGAAGAERRVAQLARASVGLAQGELMQRRDACDTSISAERYMERCRLKTARLFECACVIGSEPREADEEALETYGREIGLAFQLLDDVLDITGPPERTGKARGTDLLDGTVTLPLILGRERDPGLAALELRELDWAAAERVCDRIAATGALSDVRADARARVERAKAALTQTGLSPAQRELLELVADGVVERYA